MPSTRPFDRDRDFPLLQGFLAGLRRRVGQAAAFQYGDLVWRITYPPNGFDATTDLRIWHEADGEICGFVFYLAPDANPEFFLRPDLYETEIAEEMVAWAVERARTAGAPAIETSCIAGDIAKAAFLAREGFAPLGEEDAMVFMARALDEPVLARPLPEAYTLVSGADRPDLPSVTGAPWTPKAYAALRQAPGYRDDLALRVCYQGREIVAGAICWYDGLDRCGEFEPMGTVAAHRRKGLATAAMARIMSALAQLGATTVYVRTDASNAPARRLYERLGFRTIAVDEGWRRAVGVVQD